MRKLLPLFAILLSFAVSAQKQETLSKIIYVKNKPVAGSNNQPALSAASSHDSVRVKLIACAVSADSSWIIVADRYDPVAEQPKRDTTAPVIIRRDTIYQGGKAIGYFISGYPVPPGTWRVCLPGGQPVASMQTKDDNLMMIATVRDRKPHYLTKEGYYEQQIADFLVKRGYL